MRRFNMVKQTSFCSFSAKLILLSTLALGGCLATTPNYLRKETAQRIAAPAWMIKRDIPADSFTLRAFERIHEQGGVANLYIEGDGSEMTSPREWGNNPTPKYPLALHLASKDNAENVIYLGRPCQYIGLDAPNGCSEDFWKSKRFSNEVIDSYNTALDEISARYNIHGFNLIGYSGGGAVASLLATHRRDILSVRTVAGTLDTNSYTQVNKTAVLDGSLNPLDTASNLAFIPQFHFVGGQDAITPPSILHNYLQALPPTRCVRTMLVQEAGHEDGWVEKWPELLKEPVDCYNGDTMPEYIPVEEPIKTPVFEVREKSEKP